MDKVDQMFFNEVCAETDELLARLAKLELKIKNHAEEYEMDTHLGIVLKRHAIEIQYAYDRVRRVWQQFQEPRRKSDKNLLYNPED
jgi:hypothetical protein